MMRTEFEQLTGFYPNSALYAEIEAMYTEFNGDKQTFCKAFKKNENGMAEMAQRRADMHDWKLEFANEKEREAWDKREKELLDQHERENENFIRRYKEWVEQKEEVRVAYEKKCEELNKKCEELEAVRKELNELKAGLSAMKALFTKIS